MIQDELLDVLAAAATAAGLDRRTWRRQGQGDGELALIPPSEPEARVVDDFVGELAVSLYRRNCDRAAAERLRLRLALDHGPVRAASNGFAGRPVVAVSRLVGSAPVRQALAAADAGLAVILSRRVYTDLVLGGHTRLPADAFRRTWVREKEFAEEAWLRVPGVDTHGLALTTDGGAAASAGPDARLGPALQDGDPAVRRPDQVVVNEFAGPVEVAGGVIGIQNRWRTLPEGKAPGRERLGVEDG